MYMRGLNWLSRNIFLTKLYSTRVGIKTTNQLISSHFWQCFEQGEVFLADADDLLIGFDGLKDKYTLLGKPITDSPYLQFVKLLKNNQKILDSEYMHRLQSGTLDLRQKKKISASKITEFRTFFSKNTVDIDNGNNKPIRVVCIGEKLYIADGKHRAAMCCLENRAVKCIDATKLIYDSFYMWIIRKMKTREKDYRIHLSFYDEALRMGNLENG